jgi:hypothetical protein
MAGGPLGPPVLRLRSSHLGCQAGLSAPLSIRKSATKPSIEKRPISVPCGKSAKNPRFALSIELFALDEILQPCVGPGRLF